MSVIMAPNPEGRAQVQRDMELIRNILLEVRSRKDLRPKPLKIDGYEPLLVDRHIEMLFHEGMIEGSSSQKSISSATMEVHVTDLSWAGHDLLAALENQTVWGKIKSSLSGAELAGMPLAILKDIGLSLLKEYVAEKVGLGH